MCRFEESTHENSKHHADVVEYEEDTNPGGGQVTTESNLHQRDVLNFHVSILQSLHE
jgi:hypothetical protein